MLVHIRFNVKLLLFASAAPYLSSLVSAILVLVSVRLKHRNHRKYFLRNHVIRCRDRLIHLSRLHNIVAFNVVLAVDEVSN